jgi:Lon protease-like protein
MHRDGGGAFEVRQFSCALCLKLLLRPTTTTCGHSFCRGCLRDALKHRAQCALCRAPLLSDPERLCVATDLQRLLSEVFAAEYAERELEALKEDELERAKRAAQLVQPQAPLPCFVLTAILPLQRLSLHVFETRYRLMTQRVLQGSRRFGLVPREAPSVGTEVEIIESEELPGGSGRYLLEVRGTRIFTVTEGWQVDGYLTANVRFLDPLALELPEPGELPQGEAATTAAATTTASASASSAATAPAESASSRSTSAPQPAPDAATAPVQARVPAGETEAETLSAPTPAQEPESAAALAQLLTQSKELELLFDAYHELITSSGFVTEQTFRFYRDLGPMPPARTPDARALWIASLLNPVRPLPILAPDIRLAVLLAKSPQERVAIVAAALRQAVERLAPALGSNRLRGLLILVSPLLRFTVRYSWLVLAGWFARRYYERAIASGVSASAFASLILRLDSFLDGLLAAPQ